MKVKPEDGEAAPGAGTAEATVEAQIADHVLPPQLQLDGSGYLRRFGTGKTAMCLSRTSSATPTLDGKCSYARTPRVVGAVSVQPGGGDRQHGGPFVVWNLEVHASSSTASNLRAAVRLGGYWRRQDGHGRPIGDRHLRRAACCVQQMSVSGSHTERTSITTPQTLPWIGPRSPCTHS